MPTFDFSFLLLVVLLTIFCPVSLEGPVLLGYCLLRPVSPVQHVGFGSPVWKLVWLVLRSVGFVCGLVLTVRLLVSQWPMFQPAIAKFANLHLGGNWLLLVVPVAVLVAIMLFRSGGKLLRETYRSFCRRPWAVDAFHHQE